MANIDNLRVLTSEEAREIGRKGGIASGEARQEKATFKKALQWLLDSDIKITNGKVVDMFKDMGIDTSNLNPTQLATLGVWFGAVQGNASNYKTLLETNGELVEQEQTSTPQVNINIVDNSDLEKVLYEDENNENQ